MVCRDNLKDLKPGNHLTSDLQSVSDSSDQVLHGGLEGEGFEQGLPVLLGPRQVHCGQVSAEEDGTVQGGAGLAGVLGTHTAVADLKYRTIVQLGG